MWTILSMIYKGVDTLCIPLIQNDGCRQFFRLSIGVVSLMGIQPWIVDMSNQMEGSKGRISIHSLCIYIMNHIKTFSADIG